MIKPNVNKFKKSFVVISCVGIIPLSLYNIFTYLSRYSSLPSPTVLIPQATSVYLSGAVVTPGVYEVTSSDTIGDLISKAGGFSADADSEYVNKELDLTGKANSISKIFIPAISTDNAVETTTSEGKISINSATLEQLDALPGVGPATAQKIIDARPYRDLSDLQNVSGIGEKKYGDLADLITL